MNHQATGNGVQLLSQHVGDKVDELQRTMNQILVAMTTMAPQAIPKAADPQQSLYLTDQQCRANAHKRHFNAYLASDHGGLANQLPSVTQTVRLRLLNIPKADLRLLKSFYMSLRRQSGPLNPQLLSWEWTQGSFFSRSRSNRGQRCEAKSHKQSGVVFTMNIQVQRTASSTMVRSELLLDEALELSILQHLLFSLSHLLFAM
jgi:hypothetical protein